MTFIEWVWQWLENREWEVRFLEGEEKARVIREFESTDGDF